MAATRSARQPRADYAYQLNSMKPGYGAIARAVDAERLWRRHMELARFGATANGGVNRQALSREEIEARAELVRWGRAIGLEPSTDAVANLFLRMPGLDPALPPVLIGSHIDSQPTGGKFDGAFGVLAALESIEAIRSAGPMPRRSIEVVAWMNEEGSRFAPGMMGSAVFTGARSCEDVEAVKDKQGISVAAALAGVLGTESLPRRPLGFPVAAFLEAHIEQGPILEMERKAVGIVTGIQGKRTFRVEIEGEENHAGTSPRSARRDALVAAVGVIHALQQAMWGNDDVVRFTIGMLNVTPNAPSVVPARVVFSIDLRHPDASTLRSLGDFNSGDLPGSHRALCHSCQRAAARSAAGISGRDSSGVDRHCTELGYSFHGNTVRRGTRCALSALFVSDWHDLHSLQRRHQPQRGRERDQGRHRGRHAGTRGSRLQFG